MSEATNEDREQLRERVRAILDRTGASQKSVETACEWSSGTLTRVFGGRKAVDAELITTLAKALDTDPHTLVDGTGFAALLAEGSPPRSPDPEPAEPAVAAEPAPIPERAAEPTAVAGPEPLGERPTEIDDDDDAYADAPTERSPAIAAPELIVPEIRPPTPSRPPQSEPAPAQAQAQAQAEPTTVRTNRATPSAPPPPPPAESAPPPPAQPAPDATDPTAEPEGGVRGWLRSLAKRVFG